MALAEEYILREFIKRGAKRLGIEDRIYRYESLIRSKSKNACAIDVAMHFVDSVIIPVLQNSNQFVVTVDNNVVSKYLRNKFTKALRMNDREFVRQFIRNYALGYADVDDVVSQNVTALMVFFGFWTGYFLIDGGTCSPNATGPCVPQVNLGSQQICCAGSYSVVSTRQFVLVDNPPWINNYSSGLFGTSWLAPSSSSTIIGTGSVTIPSCFPSGGLTVGLDVVFTSSFYAGGTGASACPSGVACGDVSVQQCPGKTYSSSPVPVFYYTLNQTVVPNGSYAYWWQMTVS